MTVDTPCRCGKVTCQKRCQALAPSTCAARSSWSGTVCRPAISMIMAKENSFQTFTTISEGSDGADVVDEVGRPVGEPELHRAARR